MGTPKSVKDRQKQITEQQLAIARDQQAKQSQIFNMLTMPSLQGNAPAYFQNAILPSLESGFKQAGENLTGFFGSSGQGTSGIAAGPFAHLQADQASAISDAKTQAILQGLGLGFQGNGVFNPLAAFGGASSSNSQLAQMSQNPWMKVLGGVLSSAVGSFNPLSRIPGMGGGGSGGGGGGWGSSDSGGSPWGSSSGGGGWG